VVSEEAEMKIKHWAGAFACTAVMLGASVAPASAINNIKGFGVQETLKNYVNLSDYTDEIGYTVKTLNPSADVVPYPVAGRLWEATVTVDSLRGTVTPVIPDFNARAESGDNYRVLADVSSVSGAPLAPGQSTSGKLYFDVVGDDPNSVVYNSGFEDLLGWVNPPA
jgi:hypothetical protein